MFKRLGLALVALVATVTAVQADQYVSGYTRRDGKYVRGYYRSSPNNTVRDNYSYSGNRNPYTGTTGTDRYYSSPSSEYYQPFRPMSTPSGFGSTYGSRSTFGGSTYGSTPAFRSTFSSPYSSGSTTGGAYRNPYSSSPTYGGGSHYGAGSTFGSKRHCDCCSKSNSKSPYGSFSDYLSR